MKKFRPILVGVVLLSLLISCAPKPSDEKIDLSKARASFMLTDGSSISTDEDDDVNPVLIRLPDEYLALVFESNRDCAEGCDGSYNLFVAISEEPYSGYDIPAFYDPVVLNQMGAAHNISGSRFNFQATYGMGSVFIVLQNGSAINYLSFPEIAIPSGDTVSPPQPLQNPNQATTELVHLDTRTFSMISRDGAGNIYRTRIADTSDFGTPIYNYELAFANNAARVVPDNSGFEDAVLYEFFGYLAYGWQDEVGDYMYSFNSALDREDLELSYVSVLHMYLPETELVLFSAGEPGAPHDLYAVESHTLEELWYQDAFRGFDYSYTDNFALFTTIPAPGFDGDLQAAGGGATGVAGADNLCNTDLGQPDINRYYKAMLVDSLGNRRACSVASCGGSGVGEHIDWVFSPFTSYYQPAGGPIIDSADNNGLLGFSAAPGSVPQVWTGLNTNWTLNANHCLNWTDNSGGNSGRLGNASVTGSGAFSSGNPTCNTPGVSLYCVEQP